MRDQVRFILPIVILGLSFFVLVFVLGTRPAGQPPMIPSLVPVFGAPFGVAFAAAQMAYCLAFGMKKGLIILPIIWVLAGPLTLLGGALGVHLHEQAMQGFARVVTGASCASGIVLGILVLKGKL